MSQEEIMICITLFAFFTKKKVNDKKEQVTWRYRCFRIPYFPSLKSHSRLKYCVQNTHIATQRKTLRADDITLNCDSNIVFTRHFEVFVSLYHQVYPSYKIMNSHMALL